MIASANRVDGVERIFAAPLSSLVRRFPTEPSFVWPLLLGFVVVGIPLFLCYGYLPQSYDSPVLAATVRIVVGNWISPLIFCSFAASLAYLVLKRRSLTREYRTSAIVAEKLLPQILEREGGRIPPGDLMVRLRDELLHTCPFPGEANLLFGRCHAALARLSRQGSTGGGEEVLDEESAADTERRRMQASYLLPRFWVWAIPILGFIGTVWGISRAIEGFAGSMDAVGDQGLNIQQALARNLPDVTANLATAFDTTFLALVLSVPLMLLMTWAEKKEENYLSMLEEIWSTRILRLLLARTARAFPGANTALNETGSAAAGTESPGGAANLAAEVEVLARQVRALTGVMEDIYEVEVASRIRNDQGSGT